MAKSRKFEVCDRKTKSESFAFFPTVMEADDKAVGVCVCVCVCCLLSSRESQVRFLFCSPPVAFRFREQAEARDKDGTVEERFGVGRGAHHLLNGKI